MARVLDVVEFTVRLTENKCDIDYPVNIHLMRQGFSNYLSLKAKAARALATLLSEYKLNVVVSFFTTELSSHQLSAYWVSEDMVVIKDDGNLYENRMRHCVAKALSKKITEVTDVIVTEKTASQNA